MAEDEAEAEGGKKPEAETAPEAGETPEPVTEQQPRRLLTLVIHLNQITKNKLAVLRIRVRK